MSAVTIGDDCAPGDFMANVSPVTKRGAIDWPPAPRPLQTYTHGPVLEAFVAALREGRQLELRLVDGHAVVVEVLSPAPLYVPPFLRIAGPR